MRLLLLFEPGFAVTFVALVVKYAHEPSTRVVFAAAVIAALAVLPVALLFRKRPDGARQ